MAKTFDQLMTEARNEVKELSVDEVQKLTAKNGKYLLLDVREK